MSRATCTFDLTKRAETMQVLPQPPLFDSYAVGWQGLTFTHYCHPPYETIEHCLRQHSLVIADSKSRHHVERRLNGKNRKYNKSDGHVDVIPAFLYHQTNWDQEIEFSVIAMCPTLLNQVIEESLLNEVELIPQVAIVDPIIQQLSLALKLEIQTGCLSGKLYGESLGTALAARLVQNYSVRKTRFQTSGLSRSQLAKVIDYIKVNLAQDLSIVELASLVNMSQSHFSRSFKRSVGISPYQYLIQQRVKQAKQLLKQQSVSISSIALDCGFANQTHLTRVFRQATGMTPKIYQKRL